MLTDRSLTCYTGSGVTPGATLRGCLARVESLGHTTTGALARITVFRPDATADRDPVADVMIGTARDAGLLGRSLCELAGTWPGSVDKDALDDAMMRAQDATVRAAEATVRAAEATDRAEVAEADARRSRARLDLVRSGRDALADAVGALLYRLPAGTCQREAAALRAVLTEVDPDGALIPERGTLGGG